MLSRQKYPRLEVTAGQQLGKIFQLKKGEYSLGTHKKCNIKLSGEYASELHAVIKQNEDGVWTLTNNSPNGTYVNQLQVDSVELDQFSTIQLGAENSVDFTPLHHQSAANDGSTGEPKKKNSKWVWIAAGIAMVYLPLFAYLQNLTGNIAAAVVPPVISLAEIEKVSVQSSEFLNSLTSGAVSYAGGVPASMSLYEQIKTGSYADEEEKTELIQKLVSKTKTHLTTAHHYFQMNLHDKAQLSLKSAMSVFPDHRYPAAGYAAKTITAIKQLQPKVLSPI